MSELTKRKLAVLLKFANHRQECRCFICRGLSDDERNLLNDIWGDWLDATRKS